MKKTVIVTITKSLDVDILDEMLTEDQLKIFSSWMFPVSTADELFEHAAQYIARCDSSFVEGLGTVDYIENYEHVETEVLK